MVFILDLLARYIMYDEPWCTQSKPTKEEKRKKKLHICSPEIQSKKGVYLSSQREQPLGGQTLIITPYVENVLTSKIFRRSSRGKGSKTWNFLNFLRLTELKTAFDGPLSWTILEGAAIVRAAS